MYPIIISTPHSCSEIADRSLRRRFALKKSQIWKCSDPYTSHLKHFTCALYKHRSVSHRLVCDLNRAPEYDKAFRARDFFGRQAFKEGQGFTDDEKEELLRKYWYPYHNKIIESVKVLDKAGYKKILFVDYHNTSGDHPITHKKVYMPSLILSNLGTRNTGRRNSRRQLTSIPGKYLTALKEDVEKDLGITVEINNVYWGGYNVFWFSHVLRQDLDIKAKLYALQIEYNLDFVVNPISGRIDRKALGILQRSLDRALVKVYKELHT